MAYQSKPGPVVCRGNTVTIRDGEPVEKALRKFKKKVLESGLLQELRDRETYTKPTTKRKMAAGRAKARWRKYLASQGMKKKLY